MGKRQSTPAVVTFSLKNRERIVSKVGFATPVDFDERTQEWSFRGIGNMETDPMGLCRFTALWDTGAERTTVVPKVIRAFGLEPLEFGTIIGIDGKASPSPIYFASIGMVTCGGFAFSNVKVFALER